MSLIQNFNMWYLVKLTSNSHSQTPAASFCQTTPDFRGAHVTSLFQPREMEFDSGCSCHESSRGCIKKASQQCWQEYIYRDCVSFQEAAGVGAACHRSLWLAAPPFDLHISCPARSCTSLASWSRAGTVVLGWSERDRTDAGFCLLFLF